MLRLYFDTNVFDGLKKGYYDDLNDFLTENRDKFLIPYSAANIYDLIPSEEANTEAFKNDIEYISNFADDKFFNYDSKNFFVRNEIADTNEVLQSIKENRKEFEHFLNFDNVIGFLDDVIMELELEDQIGEDLKKANELLNRLVPIDGKEKNVKGIIQDGLDYQQKIQSEPEEYKELRKQMMESFKIPSHVHKMETDDALTFINNYIKSNTEENNFIEYTGKLLTDEQKKNVQLHYAHMYQFLGNIGYNSDSIDVKKKNVFGNHIYDSMHSFYGAHSDIFVTNDTKLIKKSKLLYKMLNIASMVVTPNELLNQLEVKLKPFELESIDIFVLENNPVAYLNEDGIDKRLYRLDSLFLEYFTHLQIEMKGNKICSLVFLKQYHNYSNHFFFEELHSIIRNMARFIGLAHLEDELVQEFHDHLEKHEIGVKNIKLTEDLQYSLQVGVGDVKLVMDYI